MKVEYITFAKRSDRSEYIAKRFSSFLIGKILDVGCDEAILRKLLPKIYYIGIDISGDADIKLDLEDINYLPFDDETFECVVCSDVLEHLNNLHHIFSELVRVARKYIIISLPNNWADARRPIGRGKGSFGHYGLPISPPQDRHKWFFCLSEAICFIEGQEKSHPISIVEMHVTEKPRPLVIRAMRRLIYPSQERYLNRYAQTLWVVFKKNEKL